MDCRKYFETLDLKPGASSEEVSQAYRDLVKIWHPDRFFGSPRLRQKAEEKLKEVNQAYCFVLSTLSSGTEFFQEGQSSQVNRWDLESTDLKSSQSMETQKVAPLSFHTAGCGVLNSVSPWARGLARIFDYALYGLILAFIEARAFFHFSEIGMVIIPIFFTFSCAFLEAVLLSISGTTPGKWILKIRVADRDDNKPGFLNAMKRSIGVWCNGIGMGIIFIAPITIMIAYYRLRRDKYSAWDYETGLLAIHENVGIPRVAIAVLFLLLSPCFYEIAGNARKLLRELREPTSEQSFRSVSLSHLQKLDFYKKKLLGRPDAPEIYCSLGSEYVALGRYGEAVEAFEKAIAEDPGSEDAYYKLGFSFAKLHFPGKAVKALNRAILIKPDFQKAHHLLGLMYLVLGRKDAALRQYRILCGLDKELASELLGYIEGVSVSENVQ